MVFKENPSYPSNFFMMDQVCVCVCFFNWKCKRDSVECPFLQNLYLTNVEV